jgi:glucose/arabinose dehydrogenase
MAKRINMLAGSLLCCMAACGGGGDGAGTAQARELSLALQPFFSGLDFPVFLTAPQGDRRQFIVERAGRVRIVDNGQLLAAPFLDIGGRTSTGGERGLLSLAFHPQYASNGYFFIYHSDLAGNIVVERLRVAAGNANAADPASSAALLTIPHPGFSNHYGGLLGFGPDGMLYIGTGDGGGAGDPNRNAQNLGSLLGKLLRVDVDAAAPGYAVPLDNPFRGQAGRRGEIWAYGLRNPWRYAFDPDHGLLYIADVGQERNEEVDVAPLGQGGNNYGWNIMEGTQCYNGAACDQSGLTSPAYEYTHGAGGANGCAITGGYVYRGAAIPQLRGEYLFSDYCGGWLKSLRYQNGRASTARDWAAGAGNVVSFGRDGQNELYLLNAAGAVLRVAAR